jgi:hypothetical protein
MSPDVAAGIRRRQRRIRRFPRDGSGAHEPPAAFCNQATGEPTRKLYLPESQNRMRGSEDAGQHWHLTTAPNVRHQGGTHQQCSRTPHIAIRMTASCWDHCLMRLALLVPTKSRTRRARPREAPLCLPQGRSAMGNGSQGPREKNPASRVTEPEPRVRRGFIETTRASCRALPDASTRLVPMNPTLARDKSHGPHACGEAT